jgi:hypothetical protein
MKGAVLPGNSTVELRDFPIPEPGHGQVLIKTNGLTNTQRGALDALLNQKPDAATSWMAWLRQPPQAPAARNILALIERLRFVRQLGIHPDRQRGIPVSAFEGLAADCLRPRRCSMFENWPFPNWPFHVDAPCSSQLSSGWKRP